MGSASPLKILRLLSMIRGSRSPVKENKMPANAERITGLPSIRKTTVPLFFEAEMSSEFNWRATTARKFCNIMINPAIILALTNPSLPRE